MNTDELRAAKIELERSGVKFVRANRIKGDAGEKGKIVLIYSHDGRRMAIAPTYIDSSKSLLRDILDAQLTNRNARANNNHFIIRVPSLAST